MSNWISVYARRLVYALLTPTKVVCLPVFWIFSNNSSADSSADVTKTFLASKSICTFCTLSEIRTTTFSSVQGDISLVSLNLEAGSNRRIILPASIIPISNFTQYSPPSLPSTFSTAPEQPPHVISTLNS